MLNGPQFQLYTGTTETWARFLEKAAKGSADATDIFAAVDVTYSFALGGTPGADEFSGIDASDDDYRQHIGLISAPSSVTALSSTASTAQWFPLPHISGTMHRPYSAYSAMWRRGQSVPVPHLISDSFHHCVSSWSADWLLQVIDDASHLGYNSLDVVTAMLVLALTWKSSAT